MTLAAAGVVATSLFTAAPGAQAASGYSGNYGAYGGEGVYPTTGCGPWNLARSTSAGYAGRTVYVKLYYSGKCGAYARIDNAPQGCRAYADRYDGGDAGSFFGTYRDPSAGWANVWEDVDPGINYAYTKMANDLNGRVARAALVCNNTIVTRTTWY